VVLILVLGRIASGQDAQKQKLDRDYQSAVADYEGGRYPQAAGELEKLLPYAPRSFEIHELMGLVYASLSQSDKALDHLKTAVQLNPNSAAARTNLGASLLHAGKVALAGEQFRQALSLEPNSFDANHDLGEFYIQSGKVADAQPLLERAQRINAGSYDNGYDLAMADFLLGKLSDARLVVRAVIKQKDTAELHNLLGQIDEGVENAKVALLHGDFESLHVEPVTCQHALGIAPLGIRRRTAAPGLSFVNDVVVDQGRGVNDLDHCPEFYGTPSLVVEQLSGQQQQHRTDTLSPALAQVFPNLRDGFDSGDRVAAELALDRGQIFG